MGAIGLGLGLRARGVRRGYDFGAGALPAGATLTRASAAMCFGADGMLASVAEDAPRFDHDPATGRLLGLLIEPGATNLIAHSGDLGAWTAEAGFGGSAPTVDAGADAAPDGGAADRASFFRGAGFSRVSLSSAAADAGPYVLSAWLRAAAAGPSVALRVDSASGETLAVDTAWRRFTLAGTGAGAAVFVELILWSAIAGSPEATAPSVWGVQLETGTRATSPIPTSGAPATRAGDALVLDWGRFGAPDGVHRVQYGFDDGSSELRDAEVSGGVASVPADLARPWLRSAMLA